MNLRRLRHFLEVARDLHFGRASARLGISQPALSASIARLESDLGVQLFDRTSRLVRLTTAGEHLLRESPALLDHAAEVSDGLRRVDSGQAGHVDLGYSRTAGWAILPAILDAMADRFAGIRITARENWPVDLVPAVVEGRVDVGLIGFADLPRGLRRTTLRLDSQGVLVSCRHRLAQRSSVSLDELAGETWQLWPRHFDPRFHDWTVAQLGRSGTPPRLDEQANPAPPQQLELDEHTARLAVRACLDLIPPGFVLLALDPPIDPVPLDLVWRPDRETPQLRRFVEVARAVARNDTSVEPPEARRQLAS